MPAVAGVDGARGGWVIAIVRPGEVRWRTARTAPDVLVATAGCAAVAVDIPLGLPTGGPDGGADGGRRECDVLAARALGPARSSIFPAPPRPVLAAATHAEACAVARTLTGGRAISLQTFHIGPKIVEWDAVDLPDGLVEAHPELAFRRLAPEVAFASKKTPRGAGQRIAALARWIDPALALADLPTGVGLDDLLDALVVAWTARRWVDGRAEVLGGEVDERGRVMRVVV
jgi:predicted RNase H-like nuclease